MESALLPLRELRIGCVRYLNARPLIGPYDGPVRLEHPSHLAAALVRGELDAALVPAYEALRSRTFPVVDGVAIAADGPVWSVFVAHQGPITRLALDPASLTSANLCHVLFAEWREPPCYVKEGEPCDARLLIGNQANDFRRREGERYRYLDFGEEWKLRTGLPFVFALWLLRPGLAEPEHYAAAFRAMAQIGEREVERYVAEAVAGGEEEAFVRRYLRESIRYRVGPREKEGLQRFEELLIKHGRLPSGGVPLRWV